MRVLLRLLGYLGGGLALTVVVALVALASARPPAGPWAARLQTVSGPLDADDQALLVRRAIDVPQLGERRAWSSFGLLIRTYEGTSRADQRAIRELREHFDTFSHMYGQCSEYWLRVGWPLPAFDHLYGDGDWETSRGLQWDIDPWEPVGPLCQLPFPLPTTPIALGVAADSAVYACGLFLIVSGARSVRRRHRLRGGRCPACGYPCDPAAQCSECGSGAPPNERCS